MFLLIGKVLKKSGKNTKKLKEANIGLVVIPYYHPSQLDKFELLSNKMKNGAIEEPKGSVSPNKMFAKHV
jgi:hypothetical protein